MPLDAKGCQVANEAALKEMQGGGATSDNTADDGGVDDDGVRRAVHPLPLRTDDEVHAAAASGAVDPQRKSKFKMLVVACKIFYADALKSAQGADDMAELAGLLEACKSMRRA